MSKEKFSIGLNDDYATIYKMDKDYKTIVSFYYGYESTYCSDHESEDECYDNDCDKSEWCFEYEGDDVKLKYTKSELIEFLPRVDGEMPDGYLLAGIAKLVDDGILEINKNKVVGKILVGKILNED